MKVDFINLAGLFSQEWPKIRSNIIGMWMSLFCTCAVSPFMEGWLIGPLFVGVHGILKKGIDDMSFTQFKQWCKRKLKRNYRVVRQLKEQLSSMEEEYARGGEEPDPPSFHQPETSSFDKGDAFDVEEPQSRHFEQHEQGTPEYNHHGMEIIPFIEAEKCSFDVDITQLYRILVS